jgi:chaperone BCS1
MVCLRKKWDDDGNCDITMSESPSTGLSLFRHEGAWFVMSRIRDSGVNSGSLEARESATVSTMFWNKPKMRSLLSDVRTCANPVADRSRIFLVSNSDREWAMLRDVSLRDPETVAGSALRELVQDLGRFRSTRDRYEAKGVPYHRGYLLHGAPGNGKTTIVSALARSFGMNLCILSLLGEWMNDRNLLRLVANMPMNSLLLIEDVDATGVGNERAVEPSGARRSAVTLSGLLNAIDGISTPPSQVVVMTTNHVDKLDHALIRPGRVDVNLEICADSQSLRDLFLIWRPDDQSGAQAFAAEFAGRSMADAQNALQTNYLSAIGETG